jgi:signal transduction histidine kinase
MSHELMPPTLKRYGLEAALVDMSQKYQMEYPIKLNLKASLKQNQLDLISETIIYRLMHQLVETLVHGHTQKADIRIVFLPSVSMATIQVKYSGGIPVGQNNTSEFIDLKALVDLLQGKMDFMMSSIWDDELNIEIPIRVSDAFEAEK